MTYTINSNCHITFTHPDISAGAPFGFLLDPQSRLRPSGFEITREITSDPVIMVNTGGTIVTVILDILLADSLINPDGSIHTDSRTAMYNSLVAYLAKKADIQIDTSLGAIANLGALGKVVDEKHFGRHSICRVQLNNAGIYFPFVDPALLNNSVWDGTLTWDTSYWR